MSRKYFNANQRSLQPSYSLSTLCFFVSPIACDVCGFGMLKDALWRQSLPENVCPPSQWGAPTHPPRKNPSTVRNRHVPSSVCVLKDYSYIVAIHIPEPKGFVSEWVWLLVCARGCVSMLVCVLLTFLYMKFYVRDLDVFVYTVLGVCVWIICGGFRCSWNTEWV